MTAPTTARPRDERAARYVAELVAAAPPPTPEQIALLRGILGPVLPQGSSR